MVWDYNLPELKSSKNAKLQWRWQCAGVCLQLLVNSPFKTNSIISPKPMQIRWAEDPLIIASMQKVLKRFMELITSALLLCSTELWLSLKLLEIPVSFEYSRGRSLFCLSSPVLKRPTAWKQSVFDETLPGTQVLCSGSAVSSLPLCFYCFTPPSFFLCLLPVSSCFFSPLLNFVLHSLCFCCISFASVCWQQA